MGKGGGHGLGRALVLGVDASEGDFATRHLDDAVSHIGARLTATPAPGLHSGLGGPKQGRAAFYAVLSDVVRKGHAYIL